MRKKNWLKLFWLKQCTHSSLSCQSDLYGMDWNGRGRASSASSTWTPTHVQKNIISGQNMLSRMRLKLAIVFFALGFCFLLLYTWIERYWPPKEECTTDLESAARRMAVAACFWCRILLWGLTPLPDDRYMMQLAMLVEAAVIWTQDLMAIRPDFSLSNVNDLMWVALDCGLTVSFLCAICWRKPGQMRRHMWLTIHGFVWIDIVVQLQRAVAMLLHCGHPTQTFLPPLIILPVSLILTRPSMRERHQSRLLALLEGRSEERAAAVVAGLVGSCGAEEIVSQAQERFRALELASLSKEDLQDNIPNPALFANSFPVRLGDVDAFVSHSWRDSADGKWVALQRWQHKFVAEHGREPRIWLDKCCIDQNNIEADLRCLPMFLSGCRKMVVFCGPTYLCRLWCVIELFTFVHMGRRLDHLEFEFVLREGEEDVDMDSIEDAFVDFDASRCDCFNPEDKERMLDIVLAAFGSISAFNAVVSDMFSRTRIENALDVCRSLTLPNRSSSSSSCSSSSSSSSSVKCGCTAYLS
eukprot:TRINITY_DN7109_c0_g2_i1.p1 TRINITY_DN7109_c0_g2~~TRINITY_DN7109_c0_g2_i1.p1  ORF type:complete len:526 (+),score=68.52 TRINITY_DN7109_c0_g2_i1:20-1597(+)